MVETNRILRLAAGTSLRSSVTSFVLCSRKTQNQSIYELTTATNIDHQLDTGYLLRQDLEKVFHEKL